MKNKLRDYYILWSTQGLSQLGSSITAFALTLWLYEKTGSALSTAALTICSYVPYVLMSIFAGALTDRWKKKPTMLVCDTFAALSTLVVFLLYKTNTLAVWHLYVINAVSGLMNTVQQPASEVTMTLIVPKECYQKTSGLNSLLRSVNSILNPLLATALYAAFGLDIVIAVDLLTFVVAFTALAGFIKIPETQSVKKEGTLKLAREGISFPNDSDSASFHVWNKSDCLCFQRNSSGLCNSESKRRQQCPWISDILCRGCDGRGKSFGFLYA